LVSGKDTRTQYETHCPLPWSRYANTTLNHDNLSIYCASADPSVTAESQVCLFASRGHLIVEIQHSTTRQSKQKISTKHDHHWSKKSSFLCVQTNWVCPSRIQRFCKNDSDSSLESLTVTRVESFCEKRDSNRVTIFFNETRVEFESPKIVTRVTLSQPISVKMVLSVVSACLIADYLYPNCFVKTICILLVSFSLIHFHKSSTTLLHGIYLLVFRMLNKWK